MNTAVNPYAYSDTTVANAPADARATFIRKTYMHLAAAVYLFAALEWALFQLVPDQMMQDLIGWIFSGWNTLIFFGAFIGVGYLADYWARSDTSPGMQYLGLSLYVVAEAIFFVPMLYFAKDLSVDVETAGRISVIGVAGLITLIMFGGLTATVFLTGKDFSFLGTALGIAGFAVLGLIVCSMLAGFTLGTLFSVGMIVLACGYILYYTSNIMYHYRTDQYVAASLALFAAVALLFWYVLRLVMALSRR